MSLDIDATRLSLLLNDLRLPAIKQIWSSFAERSDAEGWPAARLLMALAEHEIARHPELRLPVGLPLEGRDDAGGQPDPGVAGLRLRERHDRGGVADVGQGEADEQDGLVEVDVGP